MLLLSIAQEMPENTSSCTAATLAANVYVITLSSSARNPLALTRCRREGLGCQLGFGVEKALLDVAALRREADAAVRDAGPQVPRRNLSAGEFACSLAHRSVYDVMILNRIACGIVLENDAVLGGGVVALLSAMELPPSFDVLKLTLGHSFRSYDKTLRKLREGGGAPAVVEGLGGWTTTAYALSLDGARRLRELQTPVFTVSDGLLNFAAHQRQQHGGGTRREARPFQAFHLVPPLAWQADADPGGSEIGEHSGRIRRDW